MKKLIFKHAQRFSGTLLTFVLMLIIFPFQVNAFNANCTTEEYVKPSITQISAEATIPSYEETEMSLAKLASDTFNDIKTNDWYAESVGSIINMNLMCGTSPTTFAPKSLFDRSMMATILYRLAGQPTITYKESFKDVESEAWYSNAVLWSSANHIINGYGNGKYGPNDPITREQVVTVFYRYAENIFLNVTAEDELMENFHDEGDVSCFASEAMEWALTNDIIHGTPDGMLNPKATATRAEVATMMIRAIEVFQQQ